MRETRRMHQRSVAVFGSSEPLPGEPLYETARAVGRGLARAGFRVVTGGYGGVMEGASRGALEQGGSTLGVTCSLFEDRAPNVYLTRVVETPDLYQRQRVLVESSSGYVILRGKSGTLAEAFLVWALHRSGSLVGRPVVLLGDSWARLLRELADAGILEGPELRITQVVRTPEEAVQTMKERLELRGGD